MVVSRGVTFDELSTYLKPINVDIEHNTGNNASVQGGEVPNEEIEENINSLDLNEPALDEEDFQDAHDEANFIEININSKPFVTLMAKSYAEISEIPSKPARNVPYRRVIGSLMWLIIGFRADLAYSIGRLSQHSESPTEYHWISVKRVLRYINGTKNHGILYDGSLPCELKAFSDSDWAGFRKSGK